MAYTLVSCLFLSVVSTHAQSYRIEITIDGVKDTSLLLGYHLGEKKYVSDTARVDSKGHAVFTGDTLLRGGIYLVILPEKTYFEILVSDNQRFGLKTSTKNLIENLKFTNSDENTAFANYQRYMIEQQKRNKELSDKLKNLKDKPDSTKIVQEQLKKINDEVMAYWDKIIIDYKGKFLSNMVRAMKNVEIPDFTVPEGTKNADSLKWALGYRYNKEHYFDNIDFSDPRLIRTPILEGRLNNYFDRVLIPHPDSIAPEAIRVVELARANKEMFQYVLSSLLNKFITSDRMGYDGIFVALAEKYYLTGQAWWADKKQLDKIDERVKALKPNLIGNLCPDLYLPDPNGKKYRLSDLKKKVTVVYFWDPDCSHCKKATPELLKVYEKFKPKGLEVYAVFTQGDQPKWIDYISKNKLTWINVWDPTLSSNFRNLFDIYSTPVIYVLDESKKIIAKRISVESLNSMLEQLLDEKK